MKELKSPKLWLIKHQLSKRGWLLKIRHHVDACPFG